jgi:hypothetical protein
MTLKRTLELTQTSCFDLPKSYKFIEGVLFHVAQLNRWQAEI